MKAKINTNITHRNMGGKVYDIKEIVGNRITCFYKEKGKPTILVDFNASEVTLFECEGVDIYRNQAIREAVVVSINSGKYLIKYGMPNGAVYLNVLESLDEPNKYRSITKEKALKIFGYEA